MSLLSRFVNVLRGDRVNREFDEEMQSHIEEAIAHGRDPDEARRAFGPALRLREDSRDIRLAPWLDAVRSDIQFGWRQLMKNRVSSAAAVLSLALAAGSCTAAFRLIDALLLRPLPVSGPERLNVLTYSIVDGDGKSDTGDSFEYPGFRELRSAVRGDAELMAISYPARMDITWGSDQEMEKAARQYVSGTMFGSFGLKAARGRLLTAADDVTPGGHPYAVLSWHYWNSRFGRDPGVIGRSLRIGEQAYQVVGVVERGFTGTEPGTLTDIFVPTMMNAAAIDNPNWGWFRTWAHLRSGVGAEPVREKLQVAFSAYRAEQAKQWTTEEKRAADEFVRSRIALEPAAAGVSGIQKNYRLSLYILGAMVGLVLLIACANVANLMLAQATARSREMALRVSIGAGRSRLIQLVLVESALIALISSLLGGLFAWWSAPFVVSMISSPDSPTQLVLPADWRVLAFSLSLAVAVTCLFGLIPALRASAVRPVSALKGGEDMRSRNRVMHVVIAAQVAFCFLVHFVAGMFVATFDRLSTQPTGFSAENVLVLEVAGKPNVPVAPWREAVAQIRTMPGVASAALCDWALMGGNFWSSGIWINGRQPERANPYFLGVSEEWLETMRIPIVDGRSFRHDDFSPDVAVVTEAFVRQYFGGENPVGRTFERMVDKKRTPTRVIGYVPDVRYGGMRESIKPVVFVPMNSRTHAGGHGFRERNTFVVRTAGDGPLALASSLRQQIPRIRSELRVSNITTQSEIVLRQTVRERLLAMLSLFFAGIALVLAGLGLYGVLSYSVLQRRREIGIRMALGAHPAHVVRRVTSDVFVMLLAGAAIGLVGGMLSERYIETLLYQVSVRDLRMVSIPVVTLVLVALLAALPPVLRAVKTDPVSALRVE